MPWIQDLPFEPICLGRSRQSNALTSYRMELIPFLRDSQNEYDATVIHGIWSFPLLAMRIAWNGIHPYAVFAHGVLHPYFLQGPLFKRIKKYLFYRLVAASALTRAHAVIFLCEEERRLAQRSYRPITGRHVTVRFGINPPPGKPNDSQGRIAILKGQLRGKAIVLFLGRIHPIKGCDLIIEAMAQIANEFPTLHVVIAGPDEVKWAQELKSLAQFRGVGDRLHWFGPAYGDEKWSLYTLADALISPSHLESFGIVVVEALSQELPVLISDQVNIYPSIIRAEAGLVAPDSVEGTTRLLRQWMSTPEEKRVLMKRNCIRLFEEEFQATHTAADLVHVFQDAATSN